MLTVRSGLNRKSVFRHIREVAQCVAVLIAITVSVAADAREPLTADDLPTIDSLAPTGFGVAVRGVNYRADVDLNQMRRRYDLGFTIDLTPPARRKAFRVLGAGIVEVIDERGRTAVSSEPKSISSQAIVDVIQQRPIDMWTSNERLNATVSGLTMLPRKLAGIRIRVVTLTAPRTKYVDIPAVASSSMQSLAWGVRGRVIRVSDVRGKETRIDYRYITPPSVKWGNVSTVSSQVCLIEGIDTKGKVIAARSSKAGHHATHTRRSPSGTEVSGSVFISNDAKRDSRLDRIRLHVATDIVMEAVDIELRNVDLYKWPGLLPPVDSKIDPLPVAHADNGLQASIAGATFEAHSGAMMFGSTYKLQLAFNVNANEGSRIKTLVSGYSGLTGPDGRSLITRIWAAPRDTRASVYASGNRKRWGVESSVNPVIAFAMSEPGPKLSNVKVRSLVMSPQRVERSRIELPLNAQGQSAAHGISLRRANVEQGPNHIAYLNLQYSIPTRHAWNTAYPIIDVCDVVPLNRGIAAVADTQALDNPLSFTAHRDRFEYVDRVPLKAGIQSIDDLTHVDLWIGSGITAEQVEFDFGDIDLRSIPGVIPQDTDMRVTERSGSPRDGLALGRE